LQGGQEVGDETNRVIVVFVQREPSDSILRFSSRLEGGLAKLGCDERGLAKAGRG
jgi:hypothetical protein